MNKPVIAIYPSHDSSVTVYNSNGEFRVFELERLKKERFYRFDNKHDFAGTYDILKSLIKSECGEESFDTCYHQSLPDSHKEYLRNIFNVNNFEFVGHHIAHAASSFYQSSFEDALIISYDGGGFDGVNHGVSFFNFYVGSKRGGIKKIHTVNLDIGTAYGMLALPISEIEKTEQNWQQKFLGFAGKLMGLSAYGNVIDKWKPGLVKFFQMTKIHDVPVDMKRLSDAVGVDFSCNSLSGQMSYDLAATAQNVFRDIAMSEMIPLINQYNLPICMAGGCALNILVNQELHDTFNRDIYVPPNPSDCGLSFGMAALHIKPQSPPNLMYSGLPILDNIEDYNKDGVFLDDAHDELSKLLNNGKIIGIVRGNSEHGPRALGNRSILCDPSFADMKDTLNAKVKFREWFRPFAPIVRLEDVSKYFDLNRDSRYMSFSPRATVSNIPAAVHVDGTSRVQTIDYNDNPFIYDLLSKLNDKYGKGVLLNTSFNIKGKPILTTIKDALDILNDTELDYVFVASDDKSGYLFGDL